MGQSALDKFYIHSMAGRILPLALVLAVLANALFSLTILAISDELFSRVGLLLTASYALQLIACAACRYFGLRSQVNGVVVSTLLYSFLVMIGIIYLVTLNDRDYATLLYISTLMLLLHTIISTRFWMVIASWFAIIGPILALSTGTYAQFDIPPIQLIGFLYSAILSTSLLYLILIHLKRSYFRLYMESVERHRTDSLTGLYNREAWLNLVQGWIDEPSTDLGQIATLVFMDLDNLKTVNDQHGHPAGDRLLVDFADTLRRKMPDHAIVARFGGDEFVAFLPFLTPDRAEPFLQSLRRAMHRSSAHPGASLGVGVATYTSPEPIEHAIQRADQALIDEKHIRRMNDTAPDYFADMPQSVGWSTGGQ